MFGVNAEYGGALPWLTRVKILLGAAKGLDFLHKGKKPVIYRDFKPSNILLSSVPSYFLHFNNRYFHVR